MIRRPNSSLRSVGILAILVVISLTWAGSALADGRVTGTVSNEEDFIPIEGLQVLVEGTEVETTTDETGSFSLGPLPDGSYTIVFQSLGFRRQTRTVQVDGSDVDLSVDMRRAGEGEAAVQLSEVVVSSERETADVSKKTLSKTEIQTLPGAGQDAVRVVESLPGVANQGPAGFGSGGLAIRGNGPEESGYYIDGFFIPQLFHFGGLQTTINSEWLESLDYYSGGYSVRFGEALGGIVELNSRPPTSEKFSGVVDLTNYASFALVEGPIGKGTEAVAEEARKTGQPAKEPSPWSGGASVRRSFLDFILPEVIPEDQARFTIAPVFYDYQLAAQYQKDPINNFRIFWVGSVDSLGLVSDETDEEAPTADQGFDYEVAYHRPILSWTHTPSPKINNRLAVSPLYQVFRVEIYQDKFVEGEQNQIELRDDFTADLADWNTLSLGMHTGYNLFNFKADITRPPKEGDPGGADLFNDQSFLFDEDLSVYWVNGYVEDAFRLFDQRLTLTPGVRGSVGHFDSEDQSATLGYVDPRFFTRLKTTEALTLKGNVGAYHQYPQGDELLEPFGNIDLQPELSIAYGAGFEYDFGEGTQADWLEAVTLDAQGYYKQLSNMVAQTGSDDEKPYNNEGVGRVYGFEAMLRKALVDHLYGWVSYTYTVSERRDQPGDDWRPFDLDQRHNIVVVGSYEFGPLRAYKGAPEDVEKVRLWRAGARFQWASGLPYTDVDTAIYNADTDSYIPIFSSDINAERNDPLHQLDVRIDKLWLFRTWQLATYLDVQNVYIQDQPAGYIYNYDYTEREALNFPTFYPTLGFQARW